MPGAALAQSYDWSGFYAGIGMGGAQSHSTIDTDYTPPLAPPGPIPFNNEFSGGGSTVGANLGYNWQAGNILFGVEGDINALAFSGTALPVFPLASEEQLHALLSARARLGYTFDRFMVYGTAGLAAGQASVRTSAIGDSGKGTPATASGIVTGTVVGAGAEYAVTDSLSVHAGVKMYNLSPLAANGNDGVIGIGDGGKGDPVGPTDYSTTYTPRPVVFEAGINFHF